MLEVPTLGPCRIDPRPYQSEALSAISAEFASGKNSTLLVLPTGTGKTITFGLVARCMMEEGGRVLVLAHRGELITQAANSLDMLGIEAGIEKADSYARALYDAQCVIATVQTMQRKRLESWPKDHFDLIITDEAHHATADSYQKIYKHFSPTLHLGVTATADRADEDTLSDVFESVAYELSLWDSMRAPHPGPYLCRLKFVQCDVKIDLRDIRTTAGDFNQGDLEEVITPLVEVLANAIRQEVGERPTLVFTPDVGSAQALASALRQFGLSADWVSGDDKDRTDKISKLRCGELQILCNCALLTEGFDCPPISAIVLCRPTKSRPLYAQMVGRGTRLAEGKQDCLIVDFNYLTLKHDLVKPLELFDTTHSDPKLLELAQEALDNNPGCDLVDAIEKGEQEQKRRAVLHIQARERAIKYKKQVYDPCDVFETLGIAYRGYDATINLATSAQIAALHKFKVPGADTLSKKKASTLLDYLCGRARKGLATHKQVRWLITKGIDPTEARAMTFEQASDNLDRLFKR